MIDDWSHHTGSLMNCAAIDYDWDNEVAIKGDSLRRRERD